MRRNFYLLYRFRVVIVVVVLVVAFFVLIVVVMADVGDVSHVTELKVNQS